ALPFFGFVWIEVICCRDRVSTLMLREVHRSVCDLDQFLRRGAVQRITGDAEARGNILLAKQRVGGNPAAQLRSKLASLLHRSFRHENHEFIAAVTRYDVRPAAICFKDLSYALQNEVTLKVTVKIVHKFEAI